MSEADQSQVTKKGDERSILAESWAEQGFVILRGLFPAEQVDKVNRLVDELWRSRRQLPSSLTIDVHIESDQQRRMLLRDADEADRARPYKINDLYLEYPVIRDMVLDPRLCDVLQSLFRGTPLVCNSLNFEYGSQQDDHFDTFYMPSRVAGGMVASWIALDPVGPDNGPLRYWPGSHQIPAYRFSHGRTNAIEQEMPVFRAFMDREIERRGLKPETLVSEPGDVLIWHSQLLHGGCPITDPRKTRRSLVIHYFRREDYRHHFWRLRRQHRNGYYYKRRHQPVDK